MSDVFVYSLGAWSIYRYPFVIDAFAQLGNDLYIRSGDKVKRVNKNKSTDTINGVEVGPVGEVQANWLDMGMAAQNKMLEGFDIVSSSIPSVSIGYDQNNKNAFTAPFAVPSDTYTGGIIPLPLTAPSFSVKIQYTGLTAWKLTEFQLYLHDRRLKS